jgi:hypothetical protein
MVFYVIFLCISISAQGAECQPHHPDQVRFETPELCDAALWRDKSIEGLKSNQSTARSGASIQAVCVPVS